MTKASTGYTFMKVQKHSDAIVAGLLAGKVPDNQTFRTSPRFSWYDRVLLRILAQKSMSGRDIFKALFQKNPPETVLRFLQEESGFAEELHIMRSVPALKFMMPGLLELFRKD
jgi:lycopene beta-cyclase